jgi:hypothetical protein
MTGVFPNQRNACFHKESHNVKVHGWVTFTLDIEYYHLNSESWRKMFWTRRRKIMLLWLKQRNDPSRHITSMEYSNKAVISQTTQKRKSKAYLFFSKLKNTQHNGKRKRETHWSTQHYTARYRLRNMNRTHKKTRVNIGSPKRSAVSALQKHRRVTLLKIW